MKFSLVIPSHRASLSALGRLLEFASLDPARFEVVVRDNSGSAQKRSLFESLDAPALKYSAVPNHGATENTLSALAAATGDFVFMMADDDWASARGLGQLHDLAVACGKDLAVAVVTGTYFVESSTASGMFRYSDLDAPDAVDRLDAYFKANGPNLLYYAAVRRDVVRFSFEFLDRLPFKFSYHDQLLSMLYLAHGQVRQIEGVAYFYDLGEWETPEKSLAKDRAIYAAAGLPADIDRIHWLLCALEGGFLLNSQLIAGRSSYDAARMTGLWFSTMYQRFRVHRRATEYRSNPFNDAVAKLCGKWLNLPQANLNELLIDVSDAIQAADPNAAQRYFEFWSTI